MLHRIFSFFFCLDILELYNFVTRQTERMEATAFHNKSRDYQIAFVYSSTRSTIIWHPSHDNKHSMTQAGNDIHVADYNSTVLKQPCFPVNSLRRDDDNETSFIIYSCRFDIDPLHRYNCTCSLLCLWVLRWKEARIPSHYFRLNWRG